MSTNLSYEIFDAEFIQFLCSHFGKTLTDRVIAEYYKAFAHYTNEDFKEICSAVFRECDRLPAPAKFAEIAAELSRQKRLRLIPAVGPIGTGQQREWIAQRRMYEALHSQRKPHELPSATPNPIHKQGASLHLLGLRRQRNHSSPSLQRAFSEPEPPDGNQSL